MPSFFTECQDVMTKLQRAFARCQKGSGHRERCRLDVARQHKRIANRRHDFHFKKARKICEEYAVICLEDLNLKGIAARHSKKIGEYGFGAFVTILKWIAFKTGSQVVQVPWNFPSSQLCHVCGYKNPETKDLSVRRWTCPQCLTLAYPVHNMYRRADRFRLVRRFSRDRNAAINIERQGAELVLRNPSGTDEARTEVPTGT